MAALNLRASLSFANDGEWEAAARAALDVWTGDRQPRLAVIARRLTERVPTREPLPSGESSQAHRAWLEVASQRDRMDTERLFAALRTTTAKQAKERLQVLSGWRTPLLSAALVELLATPPWRDSNSLNMWTECLRLLTETSDVSVVPRLEKLAASYTTVITTSVGVTMQKRLRRALEKLHDPWALVPAKERDELCDQLEALLGPPRNEARATKGELLALVYEHPELDEPRAVLADLLADAGDPRGQFINLQLARAAGHGSPELEAAELALATPDNVAQWSAGLAPILSAAVFQRGFLSYVRLGKNKKAIEQLFESPSWSTVTSVALPRAKRPHEFPLGHITSLIAGPVGGAVETLIGAPPSMVTDLHRRGALRRIRRLMIELTMAPLRTPASVIATWLADAEPGVHLGLRDGGPGTRALTRSELGRLIRFSDDSALTGLSIEMPERFLFGSAPLFAELAGPGRIESLRFLIRGQPMFIELSRRRGEFRKLLVRDEAGVAGGGFRRELIVNLLGSLPHPVELTIDQRALHAPGIVEPRRTITASAADMLALAEAIGDDPVLLTGTVDRPALVAL